jgi:hypothetical protein
MRPLFCLLWIVALAGVARAAPRPAVIDFTQDANGDALGDQHTGPPPDVSRPSLIQGKYLGVPDAASGEAIDDPLATPARSTRSRAGWLGVRFGAGMFDDGAAAARPGVALGLAGRYRIGDPIFVAARADWSRRGGEIMAAGATSATGATGATSAIDVLGASAGAGATVARSASTGLALALIGELRGDLRLRDQRAAAPVRRAGLGLAAGAELALPSGPFTLGVRYEQGVTELVAGARDRAVLVEVGLDLR